MMIEIDKEKHAIPTSKGFKTKYPWRTMEVGDSFSVPVSLYNSLNSAKSQVGRRLGRKFIGKIIGDIYRVWRIA